MVNSVTIKKIEVGRVKFKITFEFINNDGI